MTSAAQSKDQKSRAIKWARKGISREEIGRRLGKAPAWVSATAYRDREFANRIDEAEAEAAAEAAAKPAFAKESPPAEAPGTWRVVPPRPNITIEGPMLQPPLDTENSLPQFRSYLEVRHRLLLEAVATISNRLADAQAELNAVNAAITSLDETPHLVRALRLDEEPMKKVARR